MSAALGNPAATWEIAQDWVRTRVPSRELEHARRVRFARPAAPSPVFSLLFLVHLATHYAAQEEIGRFRAGGPKCGPFSRAARTAFARARARAPSAPGAPSGSGARVSLLILVHLATHHPAQEEISRFRAGGPKCGLFSHTDGGRGAEGLAVGSYPG